MLILHLSDIHFRYPQCAGRDPEAPYRALLANDARTEGARLGGVSAIFVTGDIAFCGIKEEYVAADRWLKDLATALACPRNRIFVVPGNHDVDRRICRNNPAVRNVQAVIKACPTNKRESELNAQFRHEETGRSLLRPIEQYNDFAKDFDCNFFGPEQLSWQQDITLSPEVTLRLNGLNSTLLSGYSGNDDARGSLYLSPLQTILEPIDGVVSAVLSHHPPDWCSDNDDIEDDICNRSQLHFFGHKHRQRITSEDRYVRYYAGAVNPERDELGWEPGYNLVHLEVEAIGDKRFLKVESHLRSLQNGSNFFVSRMAASNEPVFRKSIPVRGIFSPREAAMTQPKPPSPVAATSSSHESDAPTERRNIVSRFWGLTVSQRREIAVKLDLLSAGDIGNQPEAEVYGRALLRAKQTGKLEQLEQEISLREPKK